MIAAVRGRVRRVESGAVVVSLGPMDVRVAVPAPVAMASGPGEEIELHTHLYVREDQLSLFGFGSDQALEIFELLLGVSGVGPKVALSILSALEADQVRRAILNGDAQLLTRAQGVGARAANRIVADLQAKIASAPVTAATGSELDPLSAALTALTSMGYTPLDAKRALDAVPHAATVEDLLRDALGFLADRK
jgi:holliday junction DNA helicase RuvA